ncbi:hypothetical protein [Halobaculum limi]|uniref:hypothetical protein n=1 Tax=Halobaculum limi TaxID=3031916 RepID=UPI002404E39B|nr:hypothetical protein [Halobaculum sp. YSMS11]
MSTDVALTMLQLQALAIPPVTILLKMLRRSDNLPWAARKAGFLSAIASIGLFLAGAAGAITFLVSTTSFPPVLQLTFGVTVLALLPFLFVAAVLYRDHQANFGP